MQGTLKFSINQVVHSFSPFHLLFQVQPSGKARQRDSFASMRALWKGIQNQRKPEVSHGLCPLWQGTRPKVQVSHMLCAAKARQQLQETHG